MNKERILESLNQLESILLNNDRRLEEYISRLDKIQNRAKVIQSIVIDQSETSGKNIKTSFT